MCCACVQLTQLTEKEEEPIAEDNAEWSLELQQDTGAWAAASASPVAGGATADGTLGRSLRVSAVGAYEIESKKDKSWSTMKRLEEEQRRGLQELREQEARELLIQQQLEQGLDPQLDATPDVSHSQETPPSKEGENKPWVSVRVLRSLEGGASLRRPRVAPVPSFDEDPDLATAVQLINNKPQQQQAKKQQTRKSPVEPQPDSSVSTSPSTKCDDHQQQQGNSTSNLSDSEGSVSGPVTFTFDVQKFVSFRGLSGVSAALDAELVRRKYECRPPWTTLAATEA